MYKPTKELHLCQVQDSFQDRRGRNEVNMGLCTFVLTECMYTETIKLFCVLFAVRNPSEIFENKKQEHMKPCRTVPSAAVDTEAKCGVWFLHLWHDGSNVS